MGSTTCIGYCNMRPFGYIRARQLVHLPLAIADSKVLFAISSALSCCWENVTTDRVCYRKCCLDKVGFL